VVFLAERSVGILEAATTNWPADPDDSIGQRLGQAARFAGEAIRLGSGASEAPAAASKP
jgi:hypothetical protein